MIYAAFPFNIALTDHKKAFVYRVSNLTWDCFLSRPSFQRA